MDQLELQEMEKVLEKVLEFESTEVGAAARAQGRPKARRSDSAVRFPYSQPTLPGVKIGTLVGFEETGVPLVRFAGAAADLPVPARSTVSLPLELIGREVTLVFENGDPGKPIISGCIEPLHGVRSQPMVQASVDGSQLILSAEQEVLIRCGKSSITLTRAGKVLIRGAYLSSRSSGVNRIKGGSVQIN